MRLKFGLKQISLVFSLFFTQKEYVHFPLLEGK